MSRAGRDAALVLDSARFAALWVRLKLHGDPSAAFETLTRAYAEPGRTYHTADHINDCLTQFDLEPGAAIRPDEVEMALWFHDIVYDSHAADNETRSAAWAEETLKAADASADLRERVRELVLATRHDEPPCEHDAQIITDVDLSILGRPRAVFMEFERRIRREYDWVAEPEYRRARRAVLAEFLQREPLYHTEGFRRRYEAAARQNLELAVARLADS